MRLVESTLKQDFPRLRVLVQDHQKNDIVQNSKALTSDHIESFFTMDLPKRYWLVRKAAVAIAFCGSLGMEELRSILFENIDHRAEGIFIAFKVAKKKKSWNAKYLFHSQKPQSCVLELALFHM